MIRPKIILGQNVVSCNNVRMDRMRYVPDGVTELHLVGSMWKDKGLAQLGRKEHLGLLNLSYSSIDHLNKTLLDQFPKLSTLDLSSNKLRTIFKEDLQALPNLRVLLLHSNELEEPNRNTLELFGTLQKISLRGNHTSFECECGEKETAFQKWLRKLSNRKKIIDLHDVTCISEIHGIVKIEKMDSNIDDTLCPKPTPTTPFPTKAAIKKTKKPMKAKLTTTTTAATTITSSDGVFTIDKDYMDDDNMLEDELETTTTITTMSTTKSELYVPPTNPIIPTSHLTKISPTLQSINILTTTKSVLDDDSFYDDTGFMGYVCLNTF
uniref:Uncharacterized protein n=1 Tax=Panagrolaimus superbus TaxID=310955 RepID=A0A914ZBM2_9BILA